jgi:hypothetical protein
MIEITVFTGYPAAVVSRDGNELIREGSREACELRAERERALYCLNDRGRLVVQRDYSKEKARTGK